MPSPTLRLLLALLLLPFSLAAEELRIPADQLAAQLSNSRLTLLDARPSAAYAAGHIPGAISLPVDLTYRDKASSGQIEQPDNMQKLLRERGIDIDSQVLVYDDGSLVDAARLFWTLEVYGLPKVKVLDHGFDYWLRQGYPVTTETPQVAASQYISTINHNRLASKFSTLLATQHSGKLIIDARPQDDYVGKTSSAKRFGHIPKAINIPSVHNFTSNQPAKAIKPVDELKALYAEVPTDSRVIVYCAIGRVSAATYLAMRELGIDVANYDASWQEWGNDYKLPIEK